MYGLFKTLNQRKYLLVLLTLVIVLTVGCVSTNKAFEQPGTFAVDQRFREFYQKRGGVDTLGPAISPRFERNNHEYQYIASGLMTFSPETDSDSQQYGFGALGFDLGIAEPPVLPSGNTEGRYVEGHIIFHMFVDFYDSMGGARMVGKPITEAFYNPERSRIEQHFENLGLYLGATGVNGDVHLLNYGLWKCATLCKYIPSTSNAEVQIPSVIRQSFSEAMNRFGSELTGLPLTEPYIASDGRMEQIFENVVVISDEVMPEGSSLRPLLTMLGFSPAPLVESIDDPNMLFYLVEGNKGYNIPKFLLEYITNNLGIELSGGPISEITQINGEVSRQCFENLCLDYYPSAPSGLGIRPAPLGYTFKRLFYAPDDAGGESVILVMNITIQVWERFPLLSSGQVQEIEVRVFDGEKPLQNFEPVLTLFSPSGSAKDFYLQPTNGGGQTEIFLEPILAPNGTLIEYQVCVANLDGSKFCVKDDFIIWGKQ